MGFGNESGIVLVHSLAHATELFHRCVTNKEQPGHAAKKMGLPRLQACGAVRLMKKLGRVPSPERCALIVMRDWGMEDADIAQIFGRSERWAAVVRANAEEIRQEEPIPLELEYLDEGLRPGDPSPSEIARLAEQARAARVDFPGVGNVARPLGGMRHFAWTSQRAFISVIAAQWS